MGLFRRFAQMFADRQAPGISSDISEPIAVNPATGLPTVGGFGTSDIAGNAFGTDLSCRHDHDRDRHDLWRAVSSFDDATRRHDDWASGSAGGGHDP